MMEILQRFHDSSESLPGTASKGPAPPDVIDEGEESRAEDREEEGLSSETLANFMAQVTFSVATWTCWAAMVLSAKLSSHDDIAKCVMG